MPRGQSTVVSIIHSFSAADPLDPSTLAGRWLENGAYIYFGAMNEPFLNAFRCPRLVAELAASEIPLSAVLRQGPYEAFGRPWRLVYLGDPLFHFRQDAFATRRQSVSSRRGEVSDPGRGRWTATEITAKAEPLDHRANASDPALLQWCHTAALRALCQPDGLATRGVTPDPDRLEPDDWQKVLLKINRQQLDLRLKPILDELVTDTLLNAGNSEALLDWLLRIPPAASSPRTGRTIETVAISRLASLAAGQSLTPALDLWDQLIRRPWPNSEFPAQFTQRLAALVDASPRSARELYRQRLEKAKDFLSRSEPQSRWADLINGELNRLGTNR